MNELKTRVSATVCFSAILSAAIFALAMLSGAPALAESPAQPAVQANPAAEIKSHDPELRARWAVILNEIDTKDFEGARKGLKDLEGRCADLGITSYEELSASMIKHGKLLLDAKEFGGAMALFASAKKISPNYPPAYYAEGWGYLTQNRHKVLKASDDFMDGFANSLGDFWWSFFYTGNKVTSLLFTLAVLFSMFGLLMAFRYAPLLAHDLSEKIKKPETEGGLKYLLLPGVFLTVLLVLGYWWAATLVFLLLWVYFNNKEKALALIFFVLLVFMPEIMANFAEFAGAAGNRMLWVMDDVNKGHIKKGTEVYLRKLRAMEPDNELALMSLAQIAKKEKRYDEAADYYNQLIAKNPNSAIYRNNLGNVLFLTNDLDGAIEQYNAAIQYGPKPALPLFNLSQAYGEHLMFTEREGADKKASNLDPSLVADLRERTGENRVSMVFDEPMPVGSFWKVAFADTSVNKGLADSLWSTTIKVLPLQGARAAGIGFIVLAFSLSALRRRGTYSHYCQKCGKVTCRKCQKPYYSKDLCPQCHQIFVKLEGVEARDRVRKMLEVRDKHRREGVMYRVASLIMPGAGQFLTGHPLRGFVFMGVVVFLIKDIFFGRFFRVPYDFTLPFFHPDTIALASLLVLFYLMAQLDTNHITK